MSFLFIILSRGFASVDPAHLRLLEAIKNPEYMLDHWVELPIAPKAKNKKLMQLNLREAILLALRYNPNIQSAELDRIIQRYQLRLAQNEFELQYALAGTAMITNAHYSGVGDASTQGYIASPEFNWKNGWGTEASLKTDNNVETDGNYNPLLNFSLRQPLLRGFGRKINEAGLFDAIDTEFLNKIGLKQAIIDQITQVIVNYRNLILSTNNLQIQRSQLLEAHTIFDLNQKKINSGQLERTANVQQSYQIESLNLMTSQAEQDFAIAAQDLLQAIGLDPNMHVAVPDDITVEHFIVPDQNEAIQNALSHNLQYLTLKKALQVDKRAYEVAKNQQLWQLDLTANVVAGTVTNVDRHNNALKDIYSGNNVTERAAINLTIPIHDLNRRNTLIGARIRLEKDRLNLIAAKRTLITTVKNTIATIEGLVKRYQLAQKQVDLASRAYALEKKKQQAGISSALDVNNTQNQWIQAQKALITAKIAYLNQLANLQRLLGTTLEEWQIKLRYTG